MEMDFKLVKYKSPEQLETIQLRHKILREPLGMEFTPAQLKAERQDYHLAGYLDGELVACMVLHPYSATHLKMRQVAVAEAFQRKGIGQLMVEASHKLGQENGFDYMFCHARDTAVPFYEKLGYSKTEEPFTEVGIKHWRMEREMEIK